MGFELTRNNSDVWMKEGTHRCGYVSTDVDELMFVSKDPKSCMMELSSFFDLKTEGSSDYFLGNDYRQKENGMWATSSKKCT